MSERDEEWSVGSEWSITYRNVLLQVAIRALHLISNASNQVAERSWLTLEDLVKVVHGTTKNSTNDIALSITEQNREVVVSLC